MSVSNAKRVDVDMETARSEIYAFFASILLNPPTPKFLASLLSELGISIFEALFPQHPGIASFRNVVQGYLDGAWKAEDFLLDYDSMFRVPGYAYIHPFESVYRNVGPAASKINKAIVCGSCTQRAAKVYEAEGLGPTEDFTGLPDHLGIELEFMALLCQKRARSIEEKENEDTARFRAKQRDFLTGHLLPWSKDCAARMEEKASTPLYRCLAGFLKSFIDKEEELLTMAGKA